MRVKKERMPWKTSSVMEEKLRFVFEYEQGDRSMTELCQRYEIARETGYVWIRRYREQGIEGLVEQSRAAWRHGNQTPAKIEERVLELREAHSRWGPRKLKRVLEDNEPGRVWPAASTIGALLKREGLVVERRKRRRTTPYSEPLAHADGPNRVWCADFKGWFRTGDGRRIDPLTITDAHSRYLFRCQAVEKTDTARVQAIFETCFREYGMPEAIQAGHPEQNGRHERMHRTLKQEVAQPPAANRREQQRVMERFRQEYNQVRPHEALGMQTPAAVYELSPRRFPTRIPEPEYPDDMVVLHVKSQGQFRWKKQDVFLSEVLWGEPVGLLPIDDRWFTVYFAQVPIARFDSKQLRVTPLPKAGVDYKVDAGKGEASPSPAPHPFKPDQKVSGMCPV